MKRILLIVFSHVVFSQCTYGQDLYDKLSRNLCKCLEKENVTDLRNDYRCLETILLDNMNDLIDYHGLKSITEFDAQEFAHILLGRMAKECKYLMELYKDSITKYNPQFVPDANPQCSDIHIGDFYYVQVNPETQSNDTTYVTFTDEEYLERMQNGKTYSRLSLKWESDCRFKLKFIESNDPFKNSLSKPNDIYEYEIKKVTNDLFIVQLMWNGPEFFQEYRKVK